MKIMGENKSVDKRLKEIRNEEIKLVRSQSKITQNWRERLKKIRNQEMKIMGENKRK